MRIPARTNLHARWCSDEDVDEATILEADSQLKAQMAWALVHRTTMLSVPKALEAEVNLVSLEETIQAEHKDIAKETAVLHCKSTRLVFESSKVSNVKFAEIRRNRECRSRVEVQT